MIFQGGDWTHSLYIIIIENMKKKHIYNHRHPSVKTLRSPLSAEFWKHCVLSGGTQRLNTRAKHENINFNKHLGDRTHQPRLQSHYPCTTTGFYFFLK